MDSVVSKGKGKKNLITKTWDRCKSIGRGNNSRNNPANVPRGLTKKSRSWPNSLSIAAASSPREEEYQKRCARKNKVTPVGCFSVYVGPQKQRFVIKTEYANHPLFKMLLEEAEQEYGFNSCGPLELPCNVDVFYKVLMEMDDDNGDRNQTRQGCNFRPSPYHLLSPSRMLIMNQL